MWPRNLSGIACASCGAKLAVIQTSYGARATCEPCCIRWTTLFIEEGEWTREHFSPITDNIALSTRSGAEHPVSTGGEQQLADARAGSREDG